MAEIPDINDSRAIREYYLAKTAKLDYEKARGSAIDFDQAKLAVADMVSSFRSRCLSIGSKIGPLVAAESSIPACRNLIDREISEALDELSEFDLGIFTGGAANDPPKRVDSEAAPPAEGKRVGRSKKKA